MWIQQSMSSRELCRMRAQKLDMLKNAKMNSEQGIKQEIMSQSSNSDCFSQDDTVAVNSIANNFNGQHIDDPRQQEQQGNNKRHHMSSEDEGASLSKYRKISTEENIKANTVNTNDKDSLSDSTDELSDESSDDGEKNQDQQESETISENLCSTNYDNSTTSTQNDNTQCQQYHRKDMETESDVDSFGIPPLPESSNENLATIEKIESNQTYEKLAELAKASEIANAHSHIIHTSQFSTNPNLENNDVNNTNNPNQILKQSLSDLHDNNPENIQEQQINDSNMSSTSANEVIAAEGHGIAKDHNANGEDEQVVIQNLLANAEFAILTRPSGENNFVLKKSTTNKIHSRFAAAVALPDQVYVQEGNLSHVYASNHSDQVPCTSDNGNRQDTMGMNREISVSDLNLAELVLSLKRDIQELSKKIDKQESILGAVVQANEINLAPLFAQSFPEKYNLKLPLSTIEEFDKFNQDLSRDARFCNEFITSLCSFIDNNVSLSKNILTMMRKYMTRDLVMLFTASKATGSKMVLKDTIFCKCLLQATKLTIRNGLLPLEHEKAFMKNLGLVITGAKSWPPHDEERKSSSQE